MVIRLLKHGTFLQVNYFPGSGFDMHPVLLNILENYGEPNVVRNGLRINQLSING